jgi:hypothetical protein
MKFKKHRPRLGPVVEDPQTPEEWRNALLGAKAVLMLEELKKAQLIGGGHEADTARCNEIIERAEALGYSVPEEEVIEHAVIIFFGTGVRLEEQPLQ